MCAEANAQQIEYWNEVSGPKWVDLQEDLDVQLLPLQQALISRVPAGAGDQVLDVGCGCGASTLALGALVGDTGRVTGVDISRPMLARARDRAQGHAHIDFLEGDAQVYSLPDAHYDHIVSRFGVMFFEDPGAAFAHLHTSLKPGGTFTFICWRALEESPWMTVPAQAAAQHVPIPPAGDPHAPGPAALCDRERTKRLLREAGFSQVEMSPHDELLHLGPDGTLDAGVDFTMKMGPVPKMLEDADTETITKVKEAIRKALTAYDGDEGLKLKSATWIVTAR